MPPVDRTMDIDPAVQSAQAAFRSTAHQQLKRLQAQGWEADAASYLLMDELLQQSPSHGASAASSSQLQHVVERTGFSREQALKTLLLQQEISRLRSEGHSTAALIEQLHGRLRKAGQMTLASQDENGAAASHRRFNGGPLTKKHKLSDEGAITTCTTGGDCFPHRAASREHCMGQTSEKSDKRQREETKIREDPSPLGQLKKLKVRPGQGMAES
ncbi:hypothetical protein AB1Y20_019605 [Prymnesium parvum]